MNTIYEIPNKKHTLTPLNKTILYLSAILFIITYSGCKPIVYQLIGIKVMHEFDEKMYQSFLNRVPDDMEFVEIVSESQQFEAIMEHCADTTMLHSLYQPIQILYFFGDSLVSYHINCTAPSKGLKLDWNYQGRFESFPPHSAIDCSNYSLSLTTYRKIFPEIDEHEGYSIIVFWTNMLYKISMSAIETMHENLKRFDHCIDTRIYLINGDNFFSQAEIENL